MKRKQFVLVVVGAAVCLGAGLGDQAKDPARRFGVQYAQAPIRFECNEGQTDPHVRFLSRGSGYTLFLTSNEVVLALRRPAPPPDVEPSSVVSVGGAGRPARPARPVCRTGRRLA